MIAQPLLTTGPKPPAPPQQQQQPSPNIGGFQSLLSTTDSALRDLAQNTGAGAPPSNAQQPASTTKPKSADQIVVPYVAAPSPTNVAQPSGPQPSAAQPVQIPPALPAAVAKALDASGLPMNAAIPAADAQTSTATDQSGGKGNSTDFGADALNARIVAGAPIYASQPNASLASVAPHLLDAANTHPLPGAPAGKPADDANGKAVGEASGALPAASADPANTLAAALPSHAAVGATGNGNANNADVTAAPAPPADDGTNATGNDPSTPSVSLLAQPTQPQTAPVQVDAAVHTAAPYVPVGEQVALNLKQAIAADNNEIRIQLKPASLGTIDVKLNVGQDGRVNAVISADRSDTLNMLKQDAGTLQQALRDAGLNADNGSLSFNLRGDAQSFAQNWSHGGGGGSTHAARASDALLTDTVTPAQRLHAGAVDIEV